MSSVELLYTALLGATPSARLETRLSPLGKKGHPRVPKRVENTKGDHASALNRQLCVRRIPYIIRIFASVHSYVSYCTRIHYE